MRVIVRGRQQGKTHEILNLLRKDPAAAMVCINDREAERLRRQNRDIDPHRFISAYIPRIAMNSGSLLGVHRAYLDDADLLLRQTFSPISLVGISVTEEEPEHELR